VKFFHYFLFFYETIPLFERTIEMYKKLGADEYYGQILNQPPVKVISKDSFELTTSPHFHEP